MSSDVEASTLESPANDGVSGDADTALSPDARPDVLAGPDNRRRRHAVEAALFGPVPDAALFGHHRVLHRIGEGGMGVVYAAYDERLDRRVALKLIRPGRHDGAADQRIVREARALARLSHPNVVQVYEVGELDGQIFVAMEHVAGPTLRTWLEDQERAWPEILAVYRQAGEGLAAAHAHGIVHRDFKPHNAILGADGRVRVLDFGLARLGDPGDPASARPTGVAELPADLTATGTLLGTPAYMSPEQFAGSPTDARSDQFSFCVALWEALYRERPFAGRTADELALTVTDGRLRPPPREPRVPEWIAPVLARGLQVDPAARWPTMRELLDALAGDPAARRRTRLRRLVAAVTLAGVALGGGVWAASYFEERGAAVQREALRRTWEVDQTLSLRSRLQLDRAHELVDTDPAAAIRTLAEFSRDLDSIDPDMRAQMQIDLADDAPAMRMLALTAVARGLPDAVLTGPDAELVDIMVPAGDDRLLAFDENGGLWRWRPGGARGERVATVADRVRFTIRNHRGTPVHGLRTVLAAPDGTAALARTHMPDGVGFTLVRETEHGWRQTSVALSHDPMDDLHHGPATIVGDRIISAPLAPLRAWRLADGREIEDAFPSVLADDGRDLLVAGDASLLAAGRPGDATIDLWDRGTGATRRLAVPGRFAEFLEFTADARFLLGWSVDDPAWSPDQGPHTRANRLVAWSLADGRPQPMLSDEPGTIVWPFTAGHLALGRPTARGLTLCSAEVPSGACAWSRPLADGSRDLRVSAGQRWFALERVAPRNDRRDVELRDALDGSLARRLDAVADFETSQLDRSGRYLRARGRAVDVWQTHDPSHAIWDLGPDDDEARPPRLSPDGRFALHRVRDGLARIDLSSGTWQPLAPCAPPAGEPVRWDIDDTGRALVGEVLGACLYEPGDPSPRPLDHLEPSFSDLALGPTGLFAVAVRSGTSATVKLWRAADAPPEEFHDDGVPALEFVGDGESLLVDSRMNGVHLVADGSASPLMLPDRGHIFTAVSEDRRQVALFEPSRDPARPDRVLVHDAVEHTTREVELRLDLGRRGNLAFGVSTSGTKVAVGNGREIVVVDLAGTVDRIPLAHDGYRLLFDASGSLLFAATRGGVRVWDLASKRSALLWPSTGTPVLLKLTADDHLFLLDGRELHRFALGRVPADPAALRRWLYAEDARLHPRD